MAYAITLFAAVLCALKHSIAVSSLILFCAGSKRGPGPAQLSGSIFIVVMPGDCWSDGRRALSIVRPSRMSGRRLLMAPALCRRCARSVRTALGQYSLPDLCLGPGTGMVGRVLRASSCACPSICVRLFPRCSRSFSFSGPVGLNGLGLHILKVLHPCAALLL